MKGVIKDTALLHADSYHPLRWKGVMLVLLDHSMLAPLALTSVAHDSPFPSNSYSRCPLILGVDGKGWRARRGKQSGASVGQQLFA